MLLRCAAADWLSVAPSMGVAHFCLWADLKPEDVAALDAVSNEDGTRQVLLLGCVFFGTCAPHLSPATDTRTVRTE